MITRKRHRDIRDKGIENDKESGIYTWKIIRRDTIRINQEN